MKRYICKNKCTHGNPPRMYEPGEILLSDAEECPKHFALQGEPEEPATEENAGSVLSDADNIPSDADNLSGKMTAEPCTIAQLAEKLGVEVHLVTVAANLEDVETMLTAEQVVEVTAAIKKLDDNSQDGGNEGGSDPVVSVAALANQLEVDVETVKQLSGQSNKRTMLTAEQVEEVKTKLAQG